jgi:uncharacterized repeat protein (TIGR01451 family)
MNQRNFENRVGAVPVLFTLAAIFYFCAGHAAHAANLVEEFYLPMPEAQIYQANSAIVSGTGSTIASTFSIVVTGDGTVIYYDQWEDGYETDLSNPKQSTTQIWGDGNDAHGIPPGFAHNPLGLPAGTVITLTNNVPLPRNPSQILWDARDRIASTKALVVSRAGWPIPTGPVFAGAVGVLSTIDYGTNYISPVGQNMTNNLFKYVGMFVMAQQDNTAVTIDPNGTGLGTTNIVLNQGESYLVNGGIKKGGRVTATKPVQADLVIGHVGASYASDWFTLYPQEEWSSTYYTPVSSAASGNPAYVYLFNPNTNAIVINYSTQSGSGSFPVPGTNGVFQFQTPPGSGASFVSAGGQNFFAICTVGANPASDTAYNWGFTLVPQAALTTEAIVGWGPGSADGTVDGSPVWVTPLAATRIYVDYKGDRAGPLTDPSGNHYDTNFDLATLQSQKIYDPSKNQTGMRIYTLDGTLLTAAWGEDPDVAAPGNPYIDAGTTVLPFPVPLLKKSAVILTDAPPTGLSVGDTIAYTVEVDNKGLLPLGNTVVVDAPSTNLTYLTNSTTWNGTPVPDSATGTAFPLDAPGYTIPVILSRGTSTFTYLCKVNGAGVVSNSVGVVGTAILADTTLPPAPTNGASVTLNFTDTNGVSVGLYPVGANVFVTMTNAAGNTSSNTLQTITVTVQDLTHGDTQNILLTETGTNTGVFRNIIGLPTSTTAGLAAQDGTLNVTPGDTLFVTYTDPNFGDSATNTAVIQIPALTKQLYLSVNGSTNGVQDLNRIDPVAYNHSPTRTSADLAGPSVLALDSVTTVSNTASLTATFSHTTAGVNRLMLVGISLNRLTGGTTFETPTNVTYAGIPLVLVGGRTNLTSQEAVMWIFALTNPPAGTANVVVNWDQAQTDGDVIGCATFTGVNQTTPYGPFFSNVGTGTSVSLSVSSAPGELVFDTVMLRSANFGAAGSPGASQTALWKTYFNNRVSSGASTQPGAATVTDTWTAASSVDWAIGAISIKPAASLGSTNATTFSQTQPFCSNFVMPSNNFVVITNYIAVTSGSMPVNPLVTAALQYNGANFLTLTNPTYSAVSSNLIWSSLLTTNITIPAGQLISYVISNGQPGVSFHVNYDSTNNPSKIILPASTVVAVNTLGVYDAPYPGGNLVTAPVAGSTLYVRASVSDPFGSYDITSLGLVITAPSPGANVTTNLTDTSVVANDGCSKTYEFVWPTGATTGNYNLAATAHEGTEGVTAAAAASVTLIFLDLGTPSTTEFTSGNNGPATNAYPGSAAGTVCIRVTDLNRNTNSATAQTIIATVSSDTGDFEILTLTETGTNTGVFTACVNTSTNFANVPNDGTLYAPVGSVLTASYSDPTDATDNSSATATILPPPGVSGVKMTKTLVSPASGPASVGQPVIYNLQIVNTGSTTLTNVVVTDNFPSAKLNYSSASLAPTTVAASSLTWTNLGALTPGQSTNLTVNFTALASGAATNSATASGNNATNSSSVTVLVTHSALNVTKIVLSPTNTPVAIGSNIVFRVTVQNVGDTVIPTLPLEDNFSGAYFQFVSATIPPDGIGAGSLTWTNLANPVALATNAVITNDITMKVVGQGNPANNTAVADYAVDSNGTPVPTATGSTNVVTVAATISGYVFNDKDQSGTLTAGDTPLAGVTIQIYTDPTGTGTPGTLVQVTTTSAGGYYELDNLNLGKYVVVETPLPGFGETAPANGRLAFNLTSLTASTNNDFFQYQPGASLYSTFSGTVFNDVNGNGTNTSQPGLAYVSVDLVQDVNSNGVADAGEPVIYGDTTDANGNYSFAGVVPGHYVIRETDLFGYYSSGDAQPPNDNQISFVTTNGILSTNNYFFDRLSPTAVNDTNSALYLVPTILSPLTNDISPNGDALTISNAVTADGLVIINPGGTNLTFTPTNIGVTTITYTLADAHGGTSTAIITINVTSLADLAIGKSAPATVFAASNLTYTISVTNFGPSGASSVTVTDNVPNGATFVSASGGGANNSGSVTWNFGNLPNGAISNVTLTVTAPTGGSLTNVANVASPTPDPNLTNNVTPPVITSVTALADLFIAKTGPANVLAASNFTYTISVTNLGPSSASGVVVTDTLPAGVTFISASGGGTNNFGAVSWSLGALAAGQSSNLILTVTAPASGTLTNLANVSSPTGDTNLLNNTTPPVITAVTPVADVSVVKSGPAGIIFGTNFNYTIAVSNAGPSTAASLSVTDSLPAGLQFVSAVPAAATNAASQVIWNLGNVAAGTGSNLTLTVIATQRGSFTNFASGGSPTLDPVPTNNPAPPVITAVTNNPPIANPDVYAVTENTTNTFSPTVNDVVQTPGGSLTIISVSTTNGTVTIFNNTNVIFTPAQNYLGTLTLNYIITDNVGGTNSSHITVLVTNIPPLANPDSYTVTENSTNTFPPLVNDLVRTPGGALQIIGVSPTNGTAAILNLTNVVFTPASNFVGTATIGYRITDGIGGTNSSVITVLVTNLPPTAFGQSLATPENTTLPVTLTGSDPAGQPLTFVIVSAPAGGTLTGLNTNTGAVIYTPTNNFTGTDTFTFRVNNGYNNSAAATVTIAVTPVADLLVAQSGPASGVAGANLIFTVAVTNLGPASATNIVVTNQIDSGFTFVSASANGATNGNFVTWTIPILPANGATNFSVTLFAVEGGTFTNVASGISVTPDLNATNNNGSLTNAQVVTTISALADVAVFKTGTTSVQAGGTVNYSVIATNFGPSTASNVVVRDSLPAGATLQFASGNYSVSNHVIVWAAATLRGGGATNFTVTLTAPFGGTLTNIASGTSDTADPNPGNNDGSSTNSFVVTPVTSLADLAIGKSAAASVLAASNLIYTISVTNFGPSTASSVTVTDALPAGASFVSASGGGANNFGTVIWNLGNLAGGAVSNVTLTVTAPTIGSLTNVASVGSPTSDPNLTNNATPPVVTIVTPVADVAIGKIGPVGATFNTNFSYTISVTNFGPSAASGILVTDSLPVGVAFAGATPAAATNAGGQVIWSLGNLAAGATTNLTLNVVSTARGAVTNFASTGAPTLDPSPTNNLSQPVVTLVTNVPPLANPDSYVIAENSGTNIFAPLLNDLVLNPGGVLQLIAVSTTNGAAIISGTNVLFTPGTNYFGALTISYTITDNVGGTNNSVINVLVTNLPPVANPDNYTVGENSGTNLFSPLLNDLVRTPGGALQIIGVSPTNGTATILGTNVLFAPATNFFGLATIGYTITDGIGGTNSSVITVNVTNVPPVANGQSVNTTENAPVQITLTGGDPNHLPLTFAIVSQPPNGALSGLNPNTGAVTYTPNTNFTGADSFTFRVNNGQTNSAPATVNLTVTPVADLVVAESGPATGLAGSNLIFTVSVTNRGPATATSLTISNQLASGFTFVNASGGGVNSGNLIIWNFASLPANGVTNFTVTAFATEGGTFTNVASGAAAVLDLNPTNNNGSLAGAQTVTVIAPVADIVVFKDGGTNVFAGGTVNYIITASNAGPSTATSVLVQDTLPAGATFASASGAYSVTNGVVSWSGLTLAPGTATTFNLALVAPAVSSFVNVASGSSPAFDPNLTNNNGSFVKSRVTTTVTPSADVIAAIAGPANAILGSNIVFTLNITNAGPSTASNVVVSDSLPVNLLFVSASSGGATNASHAIVWPAIASLAAGGTTNFTFTVRSLVVGIFTNIVSSTSVTFDPNLTNNTGVLAAAQAQTQVTLPQFTVLAGAPVFNPQTGLYEEQVTVTNNGATTVAGIQLLVGGLRSGVSLYNASGTNGGVPFVQYNFPMDPGNGVHFVLEFYDPLRVAFTNTLSVVVIIPSPLTMSGFTNSVAVNKVFTDTRTSPARLVIEWTSVIGKTYTVIYADNPAATNWNVATPSITATANVTQWYDDGPPKTVSAPLSVGSRFYRVIKN